MNWCGRRAFVLAVFYSMYLPQDVVPSYLYPSVYWAPKNCRFNLNKEGNSGYEFRVKPFGKLYFVCPNIALWNDISSTGPQLSMMHENLMLVDKKGYETCTVNKTGNPKLNRLILKCDGDANNLKFLEETFAPHRSGEHRMEYESGKTYYFISTSNGSKESLDNLSGGHCKTHNMRLKITVCKNEEQCAFNIPKCPFSDIIGGTTTTEASTLVATTKAAPSQSGKVAASGNRQSSTASSEKTGPSESKVTEVKIKKDLETRTTRGPTLAKRMNPSSDETIWGSPREHIIVHITMAILILILTLTLIYILITRRKPQSSNPISFNSKLYQERPTSTVPLNGEMNGFASQAV